jgi:hypothetical protein
MLIFYYLGIGFIVFLIRWKKHAIRWANSYVSSSGQRQFSEDDSIVPNITNYLAVVFTHGPIDIMIWPFIIWGWVSK